MGLIAQRGMDVMGVDLPPIARIPRIADILSRERSDANDRNLIQLHIIMAKFHVVKTGTTTTTIILKNSEGRKKH